MLKRNWFQLGDPKRKQRISSYLLSKPIRFGYIPEPLGYTIISNSQTLWQSRYRTVADTEQNATFDINRHNGKKMEFSVAKSAFSDCLSLINSVVPERSARAILQNLLLVGNADNTITLAATNLEISLKMTLDVTGLTDPCAILLPASRLNALIKGSYAEELQISAVDNKLEIKTKQGKFQVPGSEITDYPAISDFKAEGAVFIHGDDFAESVQKTLFATAKGDTRYALNGVFLNIHDNVAEFVASDTHRLSFVKKKVKNPDNSAYDGIMLTKGMATLARLAAGQELVELNITASELLAHTPNATLLVRKVDGMFPRYNDVIPPKSDNTLTIVREDLVRALHTIGLMTSEETKSVKFSISSGCVDISASSENGEGNLRLDAEVVGEDIDINFNYVFLIDACKNIVDDKVTIQYKNAESPARIDSGDFLYVIMPINSR